ncbi:spore germination protein [Cohnella endophytica]|uniref:Spore germination protein n=1 Tax=Cohnella endophytica TaxID=2419778 RepID=A0A494YBL4_9BACL|nr:spore germination protein [Cohnella endophytica]RKP58046.1 spore germination protein [Cohnella endophytica]
MTPPPSSSSATVVWSEDALRSLFTNCADVQIQAYKFDDSQASEVLLIYCEGLCDNSQIGKYVLPELAALYRRGSSFQWLSRDVSGTLPLISIDESETGEQIVEYVYQGDLVFLFQESRRLFKMNICNRPQRSPQDSSTEISIKGPRDGFTEDLVVNVALIRKRIRSSSLHYETYTIGTRTKTRIGLLYFHDILNPKTLSEVRNRLKKIEIDGIYSINQLEELLADAKMNVLPVFSITGRPDYVVNSLLAGRFIIIVDGIPMVLIGPATISLLMKSPEDIHFNYLYISFARLIRNVSLLLSISLPGFWVALAAFHQDQLPFRMMATISGARLGLPLSAQMEMFILLMLLEIFREAGVRLPSSIGQTLTVVGGLIIGDASIRAGFVSPSVVVVGAITAVTSVTLVNQSLSTVVSVLRLIIFVVSSIIGMYGLILCLIMLVGYLSRLRSFGVPYLAPLSPLHWRDVFKSYLRLPWVKMKQRPHVLRTTDRDHMEEDSP